MPTSYSHLICMMDKRHEVVSILIWQCLFVLIELFIVKFANKMRLHYRLFLDLHNGQWYDVVQAKRGIICYAIPQ